MRSFFLKTLLAIAMLSFFSTPEAQAQKLPKCVKVAKSNRPNWLKIQSPTLKKFYKNFGEDIDFGNMKLVKSELAFYLIADERNGNRIFAFELEQKGKRLFLNKFFPAQTCSEGELLLNSFLQKDGKIQGCRKGSHVVKLIEQ